MRPEAVFSFIIIVLLALATLFSILANSLTGTIGFGLLEISWVIIATSQQ